MCSSMSLIMGEGGGEGFMTDVTKLIVGGLGI